MKKLNEVEREHILSKIECYGGCSDCDDCISCNDDQIKECYECAFDKFNETFMESIGSGGYKSADEFWNNFMARGE